MTWELGQKITHAEYEANRAAIDAAVAAADAKFIRQELRMTNWTEFHRDALGLTAECKPTRAMWALWRRDRIQIDKRSLHIIKRDGDWIVQCYDTELSELLINA